jgi:CarD family transcriptional regulator
MDSFKVGDKVIYPNQGLGIIEDIQMANYFGEKSRVYHLRIFSNNTLVMVPSSNTEEIGIRKPISTRTVKKIFDFMRNGDIEVTMNWKGRYKEHLNLLRSGTMLDMVLVLKSLYYLNLVKPLSFREKKMMEKVKELIVSEISEVSALSILKIEQRIMETLSLCFKDIDSRLDS